MHQGPWASSRSEMLRWQVKGPLIRKSLSKEVNMWYTDFLVIRISMGCSAEIETSKDSCLPPSVLVGAFCELNTPSLNIEHKRFPTIATGQIKYEFAAKARVGVAFVVRAIFFQCQESICFSLGQFTHIMTSESRYWNLSSKNFISASLPVSEVPTCWSRRFCCFSTGPRHVPAACCRRADSQRSTGRESDRPRCGSRRMPPC